MLKLYPMCSQYTIKTSAAELSEAYDIAITQNYLLDLRVVPYAPAPVVLGKQFQKMNYSLVPAWSKGPKVKFASHNARIETITEKPTWKIPLVTKRCLVPISDFIESVYEKDYAGNMIKISDINDEILTAAGLWDAWTDPVTGLVTNSFAIITDEPPAFIEEIGHDRCPIFLRKEHFADWLDPQLNSPSEVIQFLKSSKSEFSFKVAIDRPLKAGWEKQK